MTAGRSAALLGWATIAYAFGVGPVVQASVRWLAPSGLGDVRSVRHAEPAVRAGAAAQEHNRGA